jgi:hypothetical protein
LARAGCVSAITNIAVGTLARHRSRITEGPSLLE